MNWPRLDKTKSEQLFNDYCNSKEYLTQFEHRELRSDLCSLFSEALAELGIGPEMIPKKNYAYQVDYIYGIKIYLLLNNKYGMNVRTASYAGVWRFIGVQVVPDIVDMRYGTNHPDRFWKKDRRLWLRVIWWYIYLSWQGDEESTRCVLMDNSTDEILQLVDRCGRGGYRVELYRELMRQHALIDPVKRRKQQIFRRIMVLNTARVQVVEPSLVDGGESRYVTNLVMYFNNI